MTDRNSCSTRLFTASRPQNSAPRLHKQKQCTTGRSSWGSSILVFDH